tara:strand:+ start:2082 stop:2795 length:714 start_codon:yes stop_codon:yes gene_type:complete
VASEFTQVLADGLDAGHVGVRTTGSVIGVGFTMLNFVGAGNTFLDQGNGTLDISIAGADDADAVIRENFVVTASTQSAFVLTEEYSTGMIDCYINGLKLAQGDFTESLPKTINLITAAVQGDTVEFVAFRSRITNTVIATDITNLNTSGIGTFNNLHISGNLTGNLGAAESTVGTSGFAANVVSLANVGTVDSNTTIAPNVGDDFTYVKYQDVKVDDNIDLTISSGDFVVDVYDLAI